MPIVEADYLHKLIPPQSAKGDWYERRGSRMVALGTIAGEYKYYLWRLQPFNGLVYFLGDEFVLHTDIFGGLVLQIHRSCNPGCATLREPMLSYISYYIMLMKN